MIKFIRNTFAYLFLTFVISNCDYKPTETNFIDVTPPQGSVDIVVLNPDSINELRGTVTFRIQTELNGHSIKFLRGFLDEMEISLYMSDSSKVVFNTGYYPDGNYTFTLVLGATTNTGSLADRLGAEALISAKQYPVTIFNAPISTPQLKDFTIENGALTLNWAKYEQPFFRLYEIIKNNKTIASISDINQTKYHDTTYFTGYASYKVVTQLKNINLESQARLFQGIPTNFVSTELLPGEKILVTWNKFPFTTSFEKYKVMGLEEDVEINSANDTTLIDESPPLGRGTYILSVFSKDEQETPKVFIKGKHIGTPFEFSEHAMLKYIPEKNIFIKINYSFTTNIQSISTYDGNSMSLIQHRDLSNSVDISQFAISDNGDYIYYAYDRKVYKINISTLITESETDIISLLPPGNYRTLSPIYSIKVNNNNKLAALIVKNNNLQMLSFFDMNSKQFLNAFHFNFGNYYDDMKITDDQQYIAFNDRIFKRLGSTLTEIGSTNTTTAAFTKDYSSIIVAMNDRIQILRISDMQLQFEIPGTFYFAPSVDLRSGLFGVNGYIFDPSTGQQRGRIRVAGLRHFYQNGLYFVDGYYKYVILN